MTKTFHDETLFGFSNFGHLPAIALAPRSVPARDRQARRAGWKLSFDFAQDGEPVEPFDICNLIFVISIIQSTYNKANPLWARLFI